MPELVIKDADRHIVMGAVYVPNSVDSDGEFMAEEDVRKAAYEFLATGKVSKIDVMHNFEESGCMVVESFIARKGDPDFTTPGTWVMGVEITDDTIWSDVKSGKINGFSFAGLVHKQKIIAEVEVTKSLSGITEKSLIDIVPEHDHEFSLFFNDNGRIISGKTDNKLGHDHVIVASDATEKALDHAHRITLET